MYAILRKSEKCTKRIAENLKNGTQQSKIRKIMLQYQKNMNYHIENHACTSGFPRGEVQVRDDPSAGAFHADLSVVQCGDLSDDGKPHSIAAASPAGMVSLVKSVPDSDAFPLRYLWPVIDHGNAVLFSHAPSIWGRMQGLPVLPGIAPFFCKIMVDLPRILWYKICWKFVISAG